MKFDPEFEFVKGGKLHGLGGGRAAIGCRSIDPNGCSLRLMWLKEGKPVLYLYDQDRKSRCGDDVEDPTGFTFEKGVWYTIAVSVKLNSSVGSSYGAAGLLIDCKKLIEVHALN